MITLSLEGMCSDVIESIYDKLVSKRIGLMAEGVPVLTLLSPSNSIFKGNYRYEHMHVFSVGNVKIKHLKNSKHPWKNSIVRSIASVYEKSDNLYVGSVYYLLK